MVVLNKLEKKKKLKDTEYLFISAYLRAREGKLLTAARMERMIDAPSPGEAAKVLQEIGYGEFSPTSDREQLFENLYRYVPDKAVVDVFKVKYDYHNLKVLLKARALGMDGKRLLVDAGRVETERMEKCVSEGTYDQLPTALGQAAEEAGEVLSTTGDPQRSDFTLDRAYFREMLEAAQSSGSQLLTGYVRATIDSANLRSAVRTLRMKKSGDFLRQVLFEGGAVGTDSILAAALNGNLEAPFRGTELRAAAELGAEAAKGGNLTAFEKACDDAVTDYAARAKHVPFGEETVIGYLVAKEIEFTAVRVIMSGKMAGIDGGTIRERLREAYV